MNHLSFQLIEAILYSVATRFSFYLRTFTIYASDRTTRTRKSDLMDKYKGRAGHKFLGSRCCVTRSWILL